jgi:hypothetical protein
MRQVRLGVGAPAPLRFCPLLVAVLVALLAAAPAQATHIAGAMYTGTDAAKRGDVLITFTVSDGGGLITTFRADLFAPDYCFNRRVDATNLSISNHAFNQQFTGGSFIAGSFMGPQAASGTLRLINTAVSCDTGVVSWTATTTATPPPPPPPPPHHHRRRHHHRLRLRRLLHPRHRHRRSRWPRGSCSASFQT